MLLHVSSLLVLAAGVIAQTIDPGNPGAENSSPNCRILGWPAPGQNYYFAPDDTLPFGEYVTSSGCTPGSYGRTWLTYPSPTLNINGNIGQQFCGYQPLDGSTLELDCPGLVRGTMPEGSYTFYTDVGSEGSVYGTFTVTHEQSTVYAATPTIPFTTTPTTTTTVTLPTTETDTATSAQITVTSPSATAPCTISITPARSTNIITSTISITVTRKSFAISTVTATHTAPCPTCHSRTPKAKRMVRRGPPHPYKKVRSVDVARRGELIRRYDDVGGIINGDGPVTTTITPAPSTTTITAATTTDTDTAYSTVSVTVTVPAVPPTVTVYSGVTTITVTLPAKTRTIHRTTRYKTTTTVGETKTWTTTATITPAC